RRRHTRCLSDWSSDVCSSDLDLRLLRRAELDLGLLRSLLETLEGHAVVLQVDALILFELLDEPIHDPLVEVVTTEVRVAVCRLQIGRASCREGGLACVVGEW